MANSGHRPGGGIASKQHVSIPVRTGSGSRGTDPGGVGQLGNKVGSHVRGQSDTGYRGEPLHSGGSFQPVPFGKQVAANTVCGPGGSREVLRSVRWAGSPR